MNLWCDRVQTLQHELLELEVAVDDAAHRGFRHELEALAPRLQAATAALEQAKVALLREETKDLPIASSRGGRARGWR